MARRETPADAGASGLLDALAFMAFVVLGAFYIIVSKTVNLPAVWVTFVPVAIMVAYAVTTRLARNLLLRDDQTGDNLYYMGFLFTLTSLGVSLWQFSVGGAAEAIVQNFGVAIATTIAGIALRLFMNQMRRDPGEIERLSRLELADAARRMKRELDSAVVEINHFRRAQLQSLRESSEEIRRLVRASASAPAPAADETDPRTAAMERLVGRLEAVLADHARAMDRLTAAMTAADGGRAVRDPAQTAGEGETR